MLSTGCVRSDDRRRKRCPVNLGGDGGYISRSRGQPISATASDLRKAVQDNVARSVPIVLLALPFGQGTPAPGSVAPTISHLAASRTARVSIEYKKNGIGGEFAIDL